MDNQPARVGARWTTSLCGQGWTSSKQEMKLRKFTRATDGAKAAHKVLKGPMDDMW